MYRIENDIITKNCISVLFAFEVERSVVNNKIGQNKTVVSEFLWLIFL